MTLIAVTLVVLTAVVSAAAIIVIGGLTCIERAIKDQTNTIYAKLSSDVQKAMVTATDARQQALAKAIRDVLIQSRSVH